MTRDSFQKNTVNEIQSGKPTNLCSRKEGREADIEQDRGNTGSHIYVSTGQPERNERSHENESATASRQNEGKYFIGGKTTTKGGGKGRERRRKVLAAEEKEE